MYSGLAKHLWMLPVVKYLNSVCCGDFHWYISAILNAVGIKIRYSQQHCVPINEKMLLGSSSRLVGLGTQLATLARSPSHQDTQVMTTLDFISPVERIWSNKQAFTSQTRWCAAMALVLSLLCFLVLPSPAWLQCPGTSLATLLALCNKCSRYPGAQVHL